MRTRAWDMLDTAQNGFLEASPPRWQQPAQRGGQISCYLHFIEEEREPPKDYTAGLNFDPMRMDYGADHVVHLK